VAAAAVAGDIAIADVVAADSVVDGRKAVVEADCTTLVTNVEGAAVKEKAVLMMSVVEASAVVVSSTVIAAVVVAMTAVVVEAAMVEIVLDAVAVATADEPAAPFCW
jgi:hypothetical protein